MVGGTTGPEYLLLRKKAEEYRGKGYEVSLETPLDLLPNFRADLVARKGDEVRVVEVKSRASLGAMPEIGELARVVDAKEGWTFELVLLGEPDRLDTPEGMHLCDRVAIQDRIEQAEQTLATGHTEAALVLAWSAVEAATREALVAEGVLERDIAKGRSVLDQGVFHGVVSRDEYDRLTDLRAYRNAIAHGYAVKDFDEGVARRVIDTAREMIAP